MKIFKQLVSLLLLAAVGLTAGGFTLGFLTIFLHCTGVLLGVPLGTMLGGLLGARTPLRDSTIVFVSWYGGMILGAEFGKRISASLPPDAPPQGYIEVLIAFLCAYLGVILFFLPVRYLVPFAQRRTIAAVLASLLLLCLFGYLYRFAYVW